MKESFSQGPNHCIQMPSVHDQFCERCYATSGFITNEYDELVCNECESFGKSTSSKTLYRYHRNVSERNHDLKFPFELTKAQRQGSAFFVSCIEDHTYGYLMAICGAGKTEMLYDGIFKLLKENKRIAIAIPRKQVVIQLFQRMKSIFPNTVIKALYEESKDDTDASILILTIQQLIYYYKEFDCLVIDEFDAFPIYNSKLYYRLFQKVVKDDGIIFVMSATENKEIEEWIQKYHVKKTEVLERFHGYPLDIPKVIHVRNLYIQISYNTVPSIILKQLNVWMKQGNYIFLYAPTLALCERLKELFVHFNYRTEMISSKSKYKQSILKDFENHKLDFLITSSILERGVTYPNLNVMVLFANHSVYSTETLIQISGRVGRSILFPTGEIILYTEFQTNAIKNAIKEIEGYRVRNVDEM